MNQEEKELHRVLLWIMLAVLCVSVSILALTPPVSKDALVHHLAVPKLYLKHGGIYEIPAMPYAYYPMNLDLLYLIPLYFGNDIIPKYIHFGFALLTAWFIFLYLKRHLNRSYALFGVFFFLSIPIVVKLSITVYVDLGLVFFITASLFFLMRWLETRFQIKYLIFSGFFCGLALGTKYNALVAFFLLTLTVPFLFARFGHISRFALWRPVSYGLIFFFTALLVTSPWMVRNYHWKKNPIYPLYESWFHPPKIDRKEIRSQEEDEQTEIGILSYRSVVYKESWWQIALLPLRIFFQGEDGGPRTFDGKLNPFLLLLAISAFYRIKEDPPELQTEKGVLAGFVVLYVAIAFFSSPMRIRYLAPVIPPLVLLSSFGLKNLIVTRSGLFSQRSIRVGALTVILSLLVGLNALYIVGQFQRGGTLAYIKGELNRDEYITRHRPEYPAFQYINSHLPQDALILFVFMGKRGYYCDRDYLPDTAGQVDALFRLIRTPQGEAQPILSKLREMGLTHLLINMGIFDKWLSESFSREEQVSVREFFKRDTRLLFLENGYGVFGLQGISG